MLFSRWGRVCIALAAIILSANAGAQEVKKAAPPEDISDHARPAPSAGPAEITIDLPQYGVLKRDVDPHSVPDEGDVGGTKNLIKGMGVVVDQLDYDRSNAVWYHIKSIWRDRNENSVDGWVKSADVRLKGPVQ